MFKEVDRYEVRTGWTWTMPVRVRWGLCPLCGERFPCPNHRDSVCFNCWWYGYEMCN